MRQILVSFSFTDKESDTQRGKQLTQAAQLLCCIWPGAGSGLELKFVLSTFFSLRQTQCLNQDPETTNKFRSLSVTQGQDAPS